MLPSFLGSAKQAWMVAIYALPEWHASKDTSKQKWAAADVSSLYPGSAHRRERTSARKRPTTVTDLDGGRRCRERRAVASQPRCAPEAAPSHIVAQRRRNDSRAHHASPAAVYTALSPPLRLRRVT